MKKSIFYSSLVIVVMFLNGVAANIHAQAGKQVAISIAGIEYDDPDFAFFRETLKKNTKVKSVKSSYADGIANLSCTYIGEPDQLWKEIPNSTKQLFKVTFLDDHSIKLEYKKGKNTAGTDKATTTGKTTKKDCFDCDYFPVCKFDDTKTYNGGHIYRGIRESDGSLRYYNCENGIVTKKWVTSSSTLYKATDYNIFDDTQTDIYYQGQPVYTVYTKIILKSNVPEGTMWEDGGSRCSIEKKDTSIIVDGVNYDHVILVMEGGDYKFYAKGVGLIKELDFSDYNKQRYEAIVSKGIIDPDLIGSWYEDKGTREYYFDKNGAGRSSFSNTGITWSIFNNKLYILNDYTLLKYDLSKSLPSITIAGVKFNRTKWKDAKKDTALNRQLIESQRFRFVPTTVNFPYPARQQRVSPGSEFVIKNDSMVVLLPGNETGGFIQFTSSKFQYSIEHDTYSVKINIQIKDTKENFDFVLQKFGNENRDATLKVKFGNKQISYIGYITDLNGN